MWTKHPQNPVFGDRSTGTCFDPLVLPWSGHGHKYAMFFSWRPKKAIALTYSEDGVSWTAPQILLSANPASGWEDDVNRCAVAERNGALFMWYTGQAHGNSYIGIAKFSMSGETLTLVSRPASPLLSPETEFEGMSVMNPCVLFEDGRFRMWYAAGETYEPNVICYAESPDGENWRKYSQNPIFTCDKRNIYEQNRVGGCQVLRHGDLYVMFYIGYEDIDTARICAAYSPDGIGNWRRDPENPLISPDKGAWDGDACYKPTVVFEGNSAKLWYNGRRGGEEYIGSAQLSEASLREAKV